MTHQEWIDQAVKLFGKDPKGWRFKCPNCGHVQTISDYLAAGVSRQRAETMIGFSCIGRVLPKCPGNLGNRKAPCDYAGGGLFHLNPVKVTTPDGKEHEVFEFAEPEPAAV